MRCHITAFVIAMFLAGTVDATSAPPDEAADAVCPRLLPAAALATDLGNGFALEGFSDGDPGFWSCTWQTEAEPPRRLMVRYNLEGPARGQALFDDYVANMKKAGIAIAAVAGVGQHAAVAATGDAFLIALRTPDAYVSITTMGVASREQALAIARRVAAVTRQSIAAARTALAAVRAHPAPVAELEAVVVRRNGKPLPCEQLLPRAEVVAIVGKSFILTFAADPRPGVSSCEWKRPTDSYAMTVHVFSEPAFRDEKMSGPVEFFNFEAKMAPCAQPPEFLPNLGEQAVICSSGDRFHKVISRRRNDVVVFSCPDCARQDAIALARAAAQ